MNAAEPLEISPHFTMRRFFAGHILGARMIEVTVTENGTIKADSLLRRPGPLPAVDHS